MYPINIEYAGNDIELIHTPEGRVIPSAGAYIYEYNVADHLGNIRAVFGDKNNDGLLTNDEIVQITDNYAFGREINYAQNLVPSPDNKYKYNGKEYQFDLAQYDYGARFYDPVIGRWEHIDLKAELYFNITPYAYAANTPVNAIDPDGSLVIFISGNHYGDGGSKKYWQRSHDESVRGSDYSISVVDLDFADAVMRQLGDGHDKYVDGAGNYFKGYHPLMSLLFPGLSGVGAADRRSAGYREGSAAAAEIIESLHRTGGVIDESIKVITHSMGAAYAKGYVQAILDYAKKHNIVGVKIEFEADFAPFQPDQQEAVEGVPTLQFSHFKDALAGNKKEKGAKNMNTSSDKEQGHSIFGFIDQVNKLPPGKYKIDGGKIVSDN